MPNPNNPVTDSGIVIRPLYTERNAPHPAAEVPGEYPFTRGIHPDMSRGRPWTMRQYAGFGTARESNARYRYLLAQGQMGISVAFDLPTQIGYDPGHPLAQGEVGRVGVSICTNDDTALRLEAHTPAHKSISITLNITAAVLLCLY